MSSKSSTIKVAIKYINLRSDVTTARTIRDTFLNIHPDFQRDFESWGNKLKTRLVETILLCRSTNPIWTVCNDKEKTEEVLDGMHRLTTTLDFINGEFSLSDDFMELDSDQYKGKTFNDLTWEVQEQFLNYEFHFNKLDSSYRNDPQKLRDMYEILNRSSKPLNTYEYNKILFLPFYDMLSSYVKLFSGTVIFQREESRRGAIQSKLIEALALSEKEIQLSSSLPKLAQKWLDDFGYKADAIHRSITDRADKIKRSLEEIMYTMKRYTETDLFVSASGTISKNIESLFIITRTVSFFDGDRSLFNRHLSSLVNTFLANFFNDGNNKNKVNRNSTFQKGLLTKIDDIIKAEVGVPPEPRFFSKKMKEQKLIEQDGLCLKCNLPITEKDKYEGDHIIPWSQKGNTVMENLQVLHESCHRAK